jgi:hypothetical protein
MKRKQDTPDWKEPFPLHEYCAVYEWIARWAKEVKESELLPIAQAASESLQAVGMVVLETMRVLNESTPSVVGPGGAQAEMTLPPADSLSTRI